jgi:hypothetical protein
METEVTQDWWDDFSAAVEDPNVSIYEFLRDRILKSLELDQAQGFGDLAGAARQRAVKELFQVRDPKEISSALQALEKNTLLFSLQLRVAIKTLRVVVDTYVASRDELAKEKLREGEIEELVGKKLAEERVTEELNELSRALESESEEEIRGTIKEAARQIGEKRNVTTMTKDAVRLTFKYLKPDNIVNIAINVLPLITWQYRWALALGLGAYACRMAAWHGAKAGYDWARGEKDGARKEGKEALTALKAAGGNVIVIGFSPVLGKLPKLLAGFAGFVIDTTYKSTLETLHKILDREKENPGSTPISKKIEKTLGGFLRKNRDTLTILSTGAVKGLVPHKVTEALAEFSKRMPLSRLQDTSRNIWKLGVSLSRRFNSTAISPENAEAKLRPDEAAAFEDVKQDLAGVGREIQACLQSAADREKKAAETRLSLAFTKPAAHAEGEPGFGPRKELPLLPPYGGLRLETSVPG